MEDQREFGFLEEMLWFEETYKDDISKYISYEKQSEQFEIDFETYTRK